MQDGTWSTLKGSCTVVRDFTDLAFHSYVDYLADFREKPPKDGRPYDIKYALKFSMTSLLLFFFIPIERSVEDKYYSF